ncbi:MAG: uncharacterized protein A8A55_1882 [Amphiamblys sp. WSBS2006]|nr:MAG: uncharacterized protein A8A55_1882 [Amphiamblys sp. WSBS2006]
MPFEKILSDELGLVKEGYDELLLSVQQDTAAAWVSSNADEINKVLFCACPPSVQKKRLKFLGIACTLSSGVVCREAVEQAVVFVKDGAEKMRKEAAKLVGAYAETYFRSGRLEEFLDIVKEDVSADDINTVFASVTTLTKTVFDFPEYLKEKEDVLSVLCSAVEAQMKRESRMVLCACLGFAKTVATVIDRSSESVGKKALGMVFLVEEKHRKYFRVGMGHVIENLSSRFTEEDVLSWVPGRERSFVQYVLRMQRRRGFAVENKETWKSASKIRYTGKSKRKGEIKKGEIARIEKGVCNPRKRNSKEKIRLD